MKVTTPGVWLLVAVIICLLAAVIIWAITARIQTKIETEGLSDNGSVTAYVSQEDLRELSVGSAVYVDDHMGEVKAINEKGDEYEVVAAVSGIENGTVNVTLVTENIAPISFFMR